MRCLPSSSPSGPFSLKLKSWCFWSPFKINRYKAARVGFLLGGISLFSRTFNPGKQSGTVVWSATNRGEFAPTGCGIRSFKHSPSFSLPLLLPHAPASIAPAWNDPGKKRFHEARVCVVENGTEMETYYAWHLHKAQHRQKDSIFSWISSYIFVLLLLIFFSFVEEKERKKEREKNEKRAFNFNFISFKMALAALKSSIPTTIAYLTQKHFPKVCRSKVASARQVTRVRKPLSILWKQRNHRYDMRGREFE